MKSYRMLTCLKCGYEFKSNIKSVGPHCNKCGSSDWMETKELFKKDDFQKFKHESSQKIEVLVDVVKTLIKKHNHLNDDVDALERKLTQYQNDATNPHNQITPQNKEKSKLDQLANMG